MRPEDDAVIHITTDGEVIVETRTDDGTQTFKRSDAGGIMNMLKSSIIHELKISSGLLPRNCIAYNCSEKGNKFVAMTFDEGYADISLEKTEYNKFPLPRLVFGFYINFEGRITSVKLGVTDFGRLTPKSQMYIYPFSNVSGFHLCTGGNTFPNIKSVYQTAGLPYYVLSMPNNYDRYSVKNTKLNLELRDLFEHLKDKTPDYYYSHVLQKMGKTLNDFIKEGN